MWDKLIEGQPCVVRFIDHSQGDSDVNLVDCTVYGVYRGMTNCRCGIVVEHWTAIDDEGELSSHNCERVAIVCSTIQRIDPLETPK